MKINNIIFYTIFLFVFAAIAGAQPKENSPYSRFGLGDLNDNRFTFLRSSGLSAALHSPNHINIINPASYGFISTTVFDLGFFAKNSTYSSGNNKSSIFSGNLDYISLAFPLLNPVNVLMERREKKYDLGLNFTLMPHSTVGFNINSTTNDPDIGIIKRFYEGSGGTYKFMAGLGGRYDQLSVGFNAGYFFGKINYSREVFFEDLTLPYYNVYQSDLAVSGFIYNAGIMYNLILNPEISKETKTKPKKIMLGLYGNGQTGFKSFTSIYNRSIPVDLNASIVDTVFYKNEESGKGTMPLSFGAGIAYNSKDQWIAGVNYSFTRWSKYSNELRDEDFLDSYEFSIGVQYTPDEYSFTDYSKRMNYRASVYYKTDPRHENDNQFDERGLHFGIGFPIVYQRKMSHINTDINIGRRGGNLLISENFVKISLSVTLNDSEWFIKRKYY